MDLLGWARPRTIFRESPRWMLGAFLAVSFLIWCPPHVTSADDGYGLQPGDVIRVSVWREQDLDQAVLVRPDGSVSFPLAGDVPAQGRTVDQLAQDIARNLSQFIPNPVVTVSLQQTEGNRIYVTGRVNKPGVYLITGPIDIIQAIAMAGGLTPFADKDEIKVLRRDVATQQAIPFDYKDVEKGRGLGQNIVLRPGDTVVVP